VVQRRWLSCLVGCVVIALSMASAAAAATPTTTRVDLSSTGAQAGHPGAENAAVSANGRWVVFESEATNLATPDSNGRRDIFLRDRKTGETRLVSVRPDGTQGDFASSRPSISGDGRWVAFTSSATNLVAGTTGSFQNVYLWDRTSGAIQRLSNAIGGGNGGSGNSTEPRISSDGSVVVFASDANNLVAGDGGKADVFLYRIATGALTLVSVDAGGGEQNGAASAPAASAEGRFVTFSSTSSDLVAGDTLGHSDVFVRDMTAGLTTRVSVTSAGGEANADSQLSTISAEGCQIAFNSTATNLVPVLEKAGALKVYVRDRCAGTTEVASISNANTQAGVESRRPAISDDGCLVGMIALGDNALVASSGWRATVVRDRCQGATNRIDLSSSSGDGGVGHTDGVSLSAGSGRYVVFHSGAENLVPGADANGADSDVFLRDLAVNTPPLADLRLTVNGQHVSADASGSSDPDGEIASVRIGFGDGSAETTGFAATHEYAHEGSYSVTAIVTDSDGSSAIAARTVTLGGPSPGPPAPPPLTLSGAALSRSRFAVAPRGGNAATLTLGASDAAQLTLRFERAVSGHRSGRRCAASIHHGPRCTTYLAAGEASAALVAGSNSVPLSGRTGTGKALAPGAYRLTLSARAADGRTASAGKQLTFTIVAAKKKGKK